MNHECPNAAGLCFNLRLMNQQQIDLSTSSANCNQPIVCTKILSLYIQLEHRSELVSSSVLSDGLRVAELWVGRDSTERLLLHQGAKLN